MHTLALAPCTDFRPGVHCEGRMAMTSCLTNHTTDCLIIQYHRAVSPFRDHKRNTKGEKIRPSIITEHPAPCSQGKKGEHRSPSPLIAHTASNLEDERAKLQAPVIKTTSPTSHKTMHPSKRGNSSRRQPPQTPHIRQPGRLVPL